MASRKTWIWIIAGFVGFCVLVLLFFAVMGVRYVAKHVSTRQVTSEEGLRSFEAARAEFSGKLPIIELDALDRPRIARPLSELPSGSQKATTMQVLVWDANDSRLVKVDLPFWLLRIGGRKINLGSRSGFDLERLNLDMDEIERIGRALVLDYKSPSGERVLVWTQ